MLSGQFVSAKFGLRSIHKAVSKKYQIQNVPLGKLHYIPLNDDKLEVKHVS